MPIPTLTPEQRTAALAKAAQARTARAAIKAELKAGTLTLPAVLAQSGDPVVGKMKVTALLESLPKVGKGCAPPRSWTSWASHRRGVWAGSGNGSGRGCWNGSRTELGPDMGRARHPRWIGKVTGSLLRVGAYPPRYGG